MNVGEKAAIAVHGLSDEAREGLAAAIACDQGMWQDGPSRPFCPPDALVLHVIRKQLSDKEEWKEMTMSNNTLGELQKRLFAELDNLEGIDVHDKDALNAEVMRAGAVEGIAKTIISNANTVLQATRARADYTAASVDVPHMLEG